MNKLAFFFFLPSRSQIEFHRCHHSSSVLFAPLKIWHATFKRKGNPDQLLYPITWQVQLQKTVLNTFLRMSTRDVKVVLLLFHFTQFTIGSNNTYIFNPLISTSITLTSRNSSHTVTGASWKLLGTDELHEITLLINLTDVVREVHIQ